MSLWSSLKSIEADSSGGSEFGNIVRGVVNKITDGQFGNGVMKRQEGESKADFVNRMLKGFGAAVTAGQDAASPLDSFKQGVIGQKVQSIVPKVLLGVGVLAGVFFIPKIFKK